MKQKYGEAGPGTQHSAKTGAFVTSWIGTADWPTFSRSQVQMGELV